jgi:regulator of cell morphogenesis and NO signaling
MALSIAFFSPFTFDSVTRYLSWDHDRLDGLLAEVTRRVTSGNFSHAASIFIAFDDGLRRHIRIEEAILFPLFEAHTGMGHTGPTVVLRAEHRLIEAELTRMRQALEIGDSAEYGTGLAVLHGVMGPHVLKEEQVLYPTVDDKLSAGDRLQLVDRLARG